MTNILLAGVVGLIVGLLGTPVAVKRFRRAGWGQLIREEGPKAHYEKRGTPTMGGIVILGGTLLGYILGHIGSGGFSPFRDSGILAMGTIIALGFLGFLDDFIKIKKSRSLGLQSRAKFLGQLVIAIVFAFLAVEVVGIGTDLSFFRSTKVDLGAFFYVWVFVMIAASSNGLNLTDGLDGLAIMPCVMVAGGLGVFAYATGNVNFAS